MLSPPAVSTNATASISTFGDRHQDENQEIRCIDDKWEHVDLCNRIYIMIIEWAWFESLKVSNHSPNQDLRRFSSFCVVSSFSSELRMGFPPCGRHPIHGHLK